MILLNQSIVSEDDVKDLMDLSSFPHEIFIFIIMMTCRI